MPAMRVRNLTPAQYRQARNERRLESHLERAVERDQSARESRARGALVARRHVSYL